jgi:hypothetical protein
MTREESCRGGIESAHAVSPAELLMNTDGSAMTASSVKLNACRVSSFRFACGDQPNQHRRGSVNDECRA